MPMTVRSSKRLACVERVPPAKQQKSVDQAFSEVFQKENRTTQVEAAASTPTPVLALTPEISHLNAQVAANLRSPAHWQDHAQSIGLKITRARSSGPIRP